MQRNESKGSDHHTESTDSVRAKESRRRQILTIALAVILLWIAGTSPAKSECHCASLQLDGFSPASTSDPRIGDPAPTHANLFAQLSNFDADADPDGWQADVVLRDAEGRVVVPARATFELLSSMPDSAHPLIRWPMPLEFDETGVAHVTLPLRKSMQSELGWTTLHRRRDPDRVGSNDVDDRWGSGQQRRRSFVTQNLYDRIGYSSTGWLRVRVVVPGSGVFRAVTPVQLRPTVLVDTWRLYR